MKIYQFEITNDCNFKCPYCPRTTSMTRPVQATTKEIIDRVAEINESPDIRLHHYGESLIEPELTLYAIRKFKEKGTKVYLNTNGSLLTNDMLKKLFEAGLDGIFLSYHNKLSLKYVDTYDKQYRDKITILKIALPEELKKYKKEMFNLKEKGFNVVLKRLRDLGNQNRKGKVPKCSFLENNEFVVLSNGKVVPCCEVYDGDYVVGDIWNNIPKENKPFKMCFGCKGYGNTDNETEQIPI